MAPGLIAINDDYRDRVVIVSVRTRRIVWQYGHTDQPGTGNGYLNTPDGLDLLAHARCAGQPDPARAPLSPDRAKPDRHGEAHADSPGAHKFPFHLPAPVEREVAVAHRSAIIIAGGLDSSGDSTNGVFRMEAGSPRSHVTGICSRSVS